MALGPAKAREVCGAHARGVMPEMEMEKFVSGDSFWRYPNAASEKFLISVQSVKVSMFWFIRPTELCGFCLLSLNLCGKGRGRKSH